MIKTFLSISSFFILFTQFVHAQCIEGNCFNGYGTYKCSCGYIYEGEFVEGEKVNGTLTKEDLVYVGEFENDVAQGQGVIRFIDSTWYEGSFFNNLPEGYGTFHYANGTTYTGEFFEGKFKGLGVLKFFDAQKVYSFKIGQFSEDQLNNFAVSIDTGGTWYIGQYIEDVAKGFGCNHSPSTGLVVGKFKKGKVNARATPSEKTNKKQIAFENYEIDNVNYNLVLSSNPGRAHIYSTDTTNLFHVSYTNADSLFFYSGPKTFPIGKSIKFNGDIYKSRADSNGTITHIEKLYPKNNEHN